MEQLISTYRLSGYRPVLADNTENFKRFVQIKKKFEKKDLYRLFAIPKIDIPQGNAYWFTEWEGTAISLGTMEEAEREKHLTFLKYEVDFLFEECRRYQEVDEEYRSLYTTLEKCIEIPDFSAIYQIKNANGESHYVLCMWGFISDAFNAQSGLIRKIIPKNFKRININVRYKGGQPAPGQPINFEYNAGNREYTSNGQGLIVLEDVLMNSSVVVFQKTADGKKSHVVTFNFTGQPEETIVIDGEPPAKPVVIDAPEPVAKPTRIKLVNWRNKIIPQQEMLFDYLSKQEKRTTNDEGRTELESLADKTKVKAKIRWKKRKYNKKFKIDSKKDEYIVKLGNRNLWWLLLLLLLIPFLMLIPLKKDVGVKVVDVKEQTGIAGAKVKLCNHERYLFNFSTGKFLTDQINCQDDLTDISGDLVFKDVKYSVFQWLFYGWEDGRLTASASCYASDSITKAFDLLLKYPPTKLELKQLGMDLDFLVVNADNNEPLPGATVKIRSVGGTIVQTLTSGVDGKVVGKDLPMCGEVIVSASAPGYISDSLKGTVSQIMNIISKRTLKLKPITRSITFYVRNLKTKEPLPGATLQLIIDGRVVQTTVSNTNGAVSMIGEATFERIHIIKTITIKASKMDFYDTTKTGVAQMFADGTKDMRTLYLRPKDKPCDIRIIDASTGKPISGAQATLTLANGTVKTEYSNVDGIVQFAGLSSSDRISIAASKEPDYNPNTSKIRNVLVSDLFAGPQGGRDIPLSPKGPPALPCQTVSIGDNIQGYDKTIEYDMGTDHGVFTFDYFTDFQRDAIFIYSGGRLVWSYDGATKRDTPTVSLRFESQIIKVRVKGDSRWWYKVNCPD